jgi:C1A family cysteine protease
MKVAILMLALLGASYALSVEQEFQAWMRVHSKSYTGAEYQRRFMNYKQTALRIARQNAQARQDGLDTEFAHNKFSDMSPAEFKAKYLSGYERNEALLSAGTRVEIEVTDVPASWNWVTQGKTTPVKDQQQCGSCWAFSATEGIESAWLMANHSQIILSPQQIVSCDTVDQGCNGGDLPTAFAYVEKAGLESNADYPYTSGGGNTGHCKYDASKVQVHISGFKYAVNDGRKNDTILATASYANGPLSICVDAETWQNYNGGIIKKNCGTALDHCVQLVGWGVSGTTEYWIVRNSWNTDWGKDGYIWIEKNSGHDLCGITEEATWVTL